MRGKITKGEKYQIIVKFVGNSKEGTCSEMI